MAGQMQTKHFDFAAAFSFLLFVFLQIILDLLHKEGPPDSRAIQGLINKLKVSATGLVRVGRV